MATFETMHVSGFRRLAKMDLRLGRLNVLIGANGCGKSSLLDAFGLLATSANGKLRTLIQDMGGITTNLTFPLLSSSSEATAMTFRLQRKVEESNPINYSLSLEPNGTSYRVANESLTQQIDPLESEQLFLWKRQSTEIDYLADVEEKILSFGLDFLQWETALSQAARVYAIAERFRAALASTKMVLAIDTGTGAPVRLPQQMREASLPGRKGEDLIACLFWMRETDPDRFEVVEDTLRVAFPSLDRLNFPPVAAGMLSLTWKDKEFTQPFYPHQLSEGTLRFLWLVTLLYSPGLPEVTLLDEPEVSLHPELLAVLADCLREASKRTQLFVATHSDRLVRFLRPEEVVVFDMQDGAASATRADELDLDEWLKEYTLDELWQHGRIGGRA